MMLWRGIVESEPFLDGRTMIVAGHWKQEAVVYPVSSERLCCGPSELPWGLAFADGVEDGEELAHGGGDGELGGLAAGDEAGIEGGLEDGGGWR
jgi:hypothetical protein